MAARGLRRSELDLAIYKPQPILTSTERELLRLLAEILVGPIPRGGSNYPSDTSVLSQSEATRLLKLLEDFAELKKFKQGAYFAEQITKPDLSHDDNLREIYLSWRKRNGRSRALASTQWFDFLRRFGRMRQNYAYVRGLTKAPDEMSYAHFREMEKLLLTGSTLHPRVTSIIMQVIDNFEMQVESSRFGFSPLKSGAISNLPKIVISSVQNFIDRNSPDILLSNTQVSGLMTVVSDVSIMFTTRDWGVAGTISTIAGGIAASTQSDIKVKPTQLL